MYQDLEFQMTMSDFSSSLLFAVGLFPPTTQALCEGKGGRRVGQRVGGAMSNFSLLIGCLGEQGLSSGQIETM